MSNYSRNNLLSSFSKYSDLPSSQEDVSLSQYIKEDEHEASEERRLDYENEIESDDERCENDVSVEDVEEDAEEMEYEAEQLNEDDQLEQSVGSAELNESIADMEENVQDTDVDDELNENEMDNSDDAQLQHVTTQLATGKHPKKEIIEIQVNFCNFAIYR